MKKYIESIFFDEIKNEFIIEHDKGIDRVSKESLKKIKYKKLPIRYWQSDDSYYLSHPFRTVIALISIALLGFSLFFLFKNIFWLSMYIPFIRKPELKINQAYLLVIGIYILLIVLIPSIFLLIHLLLNYLYGNVKLKRNFDRQLKLLGFQTESYFYNSEVISIYNIFYNEGVICENITNKIDVKFWTVKFIKLIIFGYITFLFYESSEFFSINNKQISQYLNIDSDTVKVLQSSKDTADEYIRDKYGNLLDNYSSTNYFLYYLNYTVLIIIGLIVGLLFGINLLIIVGTIFLGPYAIALYILFNLIFDLMKTRIVKYKNIKPLIKVNYLKFIFVLIIIYLFPSIFNYYYNIIIISSLLLILIYHKFIRSYFQDSFDYYLCFQDSINDNLYIPSNLYSDEKTADFLLKNNLFDSLNLMNPVLFLENKSWVEDKLLKGYKFLNHCPETIKIKFNRHFYLQHINDYHKNYRLDLTPLAYFSNDVEIILCLLQIDGLHLEFASNNLKSDREIVLFAIKKNGLALQFANESLKKDKKIVLTALENNGLALEYVNAGLRADIDVVRTALLSNKDAYLYIDPSLENNEEILKILDISKTSKDATTQS